MIKVTITWLFMFAVEIHEMNAADLLSILARHTGQLRLIFAEQSSQRQT